MGKIKLLIFAFIIGMCGCSSNQDTLDLSGEWEVSLDSMSTFQPIQLPGTTDLAGLGVPCELTPELEKPQLLHLTRKHSYIGAAYYRRRVNIPQSMANRPLTLSLERVMWQSRLWIDGVEHPCAEESLCTPHEYHIADGLEAGEHELLLRIDNRKRHDISVKELAHAYTEDTQVKWNGVLGRMELRADNGIRIQQVSTYPDVKGKAVRVAVTLVRTGADVSEATLTLQAARPDAGQSLETVTLDVPIDADTVRVEHEYALGDAVALWDEFSPTLYTMTVDCDVEGRTERKQTTFGMREIDGSHGYLAVNGQRTFLRGTLECCIFPLTGTPPMDDAGWEKVFASAKEWGLNHLRFHSYCPPEAAFRVADRMGFYLQVELPNWSLTVGQDSATSRFLYQEYERIVAAYGNHPSFCMMSVGNELQPDFGFLNEFVQYMKRHDDRHLYTTTTFTFEPGHGTHPEPEDEFFVTQWTDHGWVRGQGVFDAERPDFTKDYREAAQGIGVPLISHEIGQYAVYPNVDEIGKYTGTLDPLNFKAVRKDLEEKGLLDKAPLYLQASGKLAAILYKEEIERALKTPQFSGYQLLGLQDFSGQGTALVGLVDAFWDSKGVADPSSFKQFCAPVVPLARFPKAVWSADERFVAGIEIANYYKEDIIGKQVHWTLRNDSGDSVAGGAFKADTIGKGKVTELGEIQAALSGVHEACRLSLEVGIEDTDWRNSWSIWIYPRIKKASAGDVLVTRSLDEALDALGQGRSVLLSPESSRLNGLEGKFLPVFWSPVHFPKQAGTMGLLCNPDHPALRNFPTDMHSDWQWWNLVKSSRAMVIDSLPAAQPIVESVDNFTNNRRLAYIFEARCKGGKVVVSSMDLLSADDDKPEVAQLRYSIEQYMSSTDFAPKGHISEDMLKSLFADGNTGSKVTDATSIYE